MPYFSKFYEIEVRDEIAKEFTDSGGKVDDMMAGLHEIRARLSEEIPYLKRIHKHLMEKESPLSIPSSVS